MLRERERTSLQSSFRLFRDKDPLPAAMQSFYCIKNPGKV